MTTASCLCGTITIKTNILAKEIHACHCNQCQRWTGGGPLFVIPVAGLEITGSDHIATYNASEHGERAFCTRCGTSLYWTMRGQMPGYLPIGLFDDQNGFTVKEEIFIDYRPGWIKPIEEANQSTEAEQNELLEEYKKSRLSDN